MIATDQTRRSCTALANRGRPHMGYGLAGGACAPARPDEMISRFHPR